MSQAWIKEEGSAYNFVNRNGHHKLSINLFNVFKYSTEKSRCHECPPTEEIVRFASRKVRFQVLSGRKKRTESHGRIFINEHLTKSTGTIFAAARKLAKEKKVLRASTKTGHVVVKLINDRLD